MSDNVIYISGVHGSGKSTLIHALCQDEDVFVRSRKMRIPKPEEICERQLVRFCRFYLQSFQEQELAQNYPDKFVLCDRGWYDALAYTNGFAKMRWLGEEEYKHMRDLVEFFFEGNKGKIVFLNPPLEYVEEKLQERWQKRGKKWNEDDFDYLSMVYESYQYLYNKLTCQKMEIKETGLQERVDKICQWLTIPRVLISQT